MNSTAVTIPGYRLIEQIHLSSKTQVWRSRSESDQQPVVIKLLLSEYPTFRELVQFRNQYTIAKNLDLTGIIKPIALLNYRNGFALVMEDIGGVSLSDYTLNRQLNLKEFLPIAISIVQTLEGVHHHRIIHKDIKPQNILINPQNQQVKLIDFSISSLLPRENQETQNPNVLEGTLAYMSPEQTGRMNRGIDYRTDFYSLGVTFYELLTGQLPFKLTDPMELVHSHIARQPTPPIELVPTLPGMVNEMIMKLMAKNAESRYQSALGLRFDLEICWQQYLEKGRISQFSLGGRDICDRFVIPEKLYGRESEVQTLLSAFERISQGHTEILLVAGFSGIGKTAVVNEVHKPIIRQRGYFIKGKFDQFKRDIPFWAWVQAFQNLMRQLLTESAVEIQAWKAFILEALGENGQVIIDVIPELELLIGKQSSVPELEGSAAQNRFNLLFEKFILVFATKEHPLVIFLDDLQWADSGSLKLMQLLMSQAETGYLLLIGAYRDNEVSPAHPLILTLEQIRKSQVTVNQITLPPLNKPSLNRLIADTLSCPPETAVPLTELIYQRTQGNPFFSNQFLKSLHQDGLIYFNFTCPYQGVTRGGWQCDIAQVRTLTLTDDVVEFMALQLQKLSLNTQDILKLAACIGNPFDLATLAIVSEKSQAETAADLWTALQEGVVIPITEVYKFFQDSEAVEVAQVKDLSVPYRFLHDRVQQAAYFLIPESQKQSTHLKIGRLLLRNTPVEEQEEKIFDIVNQLNIAVELIDQELERNQLAQLNLTAGRKAKASTAYAAALRYLAIGLELLATSSWQTQYEFTLSLYNEAVEVAFLNRNFQQMEQLVDTVLKQGKKLLDKVKVYNVKIQACMVLNQQLEAVKIALPILKLLGVEFPQKPNQLDVQLALEETRSNLSGKRIEDLIHLPPMTEPTKLAAMKILSSVFSAAYQAIPEMFPLIVCKQVNLSIQHGNASGSAFAYATYGLILCGIVGDLELGYQVGQLALNLLNQVNAKEVKTRTMQIVYSFVSHWQEPLCQTLQPLREAYQSGWETGDLEYAAYCGAVYYLHSFFMGKELSSLEPEMLTYTEAIRHIQQETALNYHQVYEQLVLNLLGKSVNHCLLIGESYNEDQMLPLHFKINDKTAIYYLYFNKSLLYYLFGESEQAAKYIALAEQYLNGVTATLNVPLFYFYDSLVKLAGYKDASKSEQEEILLKVTTNQEKMKKWSDYSPANYLHKFHLVAAERHRVLGEKIEAIDSYDHAIASAQENEYINEEALADELAAKFYLEWGKEKIAQVYLTDAYYAYSRWGAKAKVEDLEKCYPQLLTSIFYQKKTLNSGETISEMNKKTISSTSSNVSDVLDLETVIKASQSLSVEINLNQLLSTLMQVMIENAGAQKGTLILIEGDALAIASQYASGQPSNLDSLSVINPQEIPLTLIHYVWRTQETLVINDARIQPTFAADSYIIQQQPKSVLCIPIRNQGKLIGILYLENNLTTNAFTPERLAVLTILSSQAAISLENAKLYATLETKVEERTQELSQALSHLKATQEELIQAEKKAALGQLVAGIAHEINTPLGAIHSAAGNISTSLDQTLEQLPALFQSLSPEESQKFLALLQRSLQQELTFSTREERQFKRALRQQLAEIDDADIIAEGLVSMGIHNDIDAFISLFKKTDSWRILEIAYKLSELKRGTVTINTATKRAAKIVFALKTYAHYNHLGEMIPAQLTDGIETILTLYQNQLKQGVKIIRNYAELPEILCDPEELNHVWTNLVHNALQAMNYRGTLTIDVIQLEQQAQISFTDSGVGIPEEIQGKIFEPFFTTKPPGEGSGLGLNIVKKIIEKHQGQIEFKSMPGQTTFTVSIPLKIKNNYVQ